MTSLRGHITSLNKDLVFLILQFLNEKKHKETVHKLETESGLFFNMSYFEDCVTNGEWDEAENYLSGFTKMEDNPNSMKIFFEIRKQKFLEAHDKHDRAKAVEILTNDLKVFSTLYKDLYEDLFKEIALLLTLHNFRENEGLSNYGDTNSARAMILGELKRLIVVNPRFCDKLQFPTLKNCRLQTLIIQSLKWQHQQCKYPKPNSVVKTLFRDHSCGQPPHGTNPLIGSMPKIGGFPPVGAHGPFQPAPAPPTAFLAGSMANPSSIVHQGADGGPMGLTPPNNAVPMLKRPRTSPDSPMLDYQTVDSEHVTERSIPFGISKEVNDPGQMHVLPTYGSDDLPKTVVASLNQGSAIKSMDFHPVQLTLLLVGTNLGDITLWEVSSREKLASRNFNVWDLTSCSMALQASLANEYTASVNRVIWSPNGRFCGVAYSKHIVHIYFYQGGNDFKNHLEIDAHIGNVNDLAFSHRNDQLALITCGEDKTVKVWDAATGSKLNTFEGHEAPLYSVCPHYKGNIQYIISTSIDGKIKIWLYDNISPVVNYDVQDPSCTRMAYSANGTRLFSCGTNKDGKSNLVEWNNTEGDVKRKYDGLGKRSVGVVQFDTTMNRFLAAGDEFVIKIWDMNDTNLLTTIDAEGGLSASPCIRFNKEGTRLAVSTNENGVKILAKADGARMIHTIEGHAQDPSRIASGSVVRAPMIPTYGASGSNAGPSIGVTDRNAPSVTIVAPDGDAQSLPHVEPSKSYELEKSKIWQLVEINEPSQLRSLRLSDSLLAIIRLIYTNSGNAILSLAHNAVHKLWKWQTNERNLSGKATTAVPPELWQPSSGILMTNDTSETNPVEAVPCLALTKNDSYVISASGGKISLFSMVTFKSMTTFMSPPPAATSVALHPENNDVIAIGMEDSTIQIYYFRSQRVKSQLKGHQKRVTGLAFSNVLRVLVSAGADAQICVWSTDGWEKKVNKFLKIPPERETNSNARTRVQFHQDQSHVLVVHETLIAVYEASKLNCIKQRVIRESSDAITDATYSCDSQLIYVSFEGGSICVLTAALDLRSRINPAAYLPSNPSSRPHPLVIAAHPSKANQFALGLTDGGVHVLEPLESEGKWDSAATDENSVNPGASGVDKTSR